MPEHLNETLHLAQNWQHQLAAAFTALPDLCAYLQLSVNDLPVSTAACKNFPLRVPLSFAASMEKGNPHDPLLRQVLPISDELNVYPGYSNDPVGDLPAAKQIGVLHKYHGRALLINTGSCAINCRYCFRRNFPYADLQLGKQQETAALEYLKTHPEISEIILSGGDPLLLSDARLATLLQQLAELPQLARIRIHTRLPIVLPARITDDLINTLSATGKQTVMVVHCNHARELSPRVQAACLRLKASGMTLFNQSVLLQGVNDDADSLCDLSEQLFSIGIIPYYLHLLDKATGTGHFDVPEHQALALLAQVQTRLPGYLVPKLVKELAGAQSKVSI